VEGEPVTEHDVLTGFRLRLFTLADELGNVAAACRAMGVGRQRQEGGELDRSALKAIRPVGYMRTATLLFFRRRRAGNGQAAVAPAWRRPTLSARCC
jgi:hypothetical protein